MKSHNFLKRKFSEIEKKKKEKEDFCKNFLFLDLISSFVINPFQITFPYKKQGK